MLKLAREYPDAEIIAIGKRACERYGKPFTSSEHFDFSDAMALSERLCEGAHRRRSDNHEDDITVITAVLKKSV